MVKDGRVDLHAAPAAVRSAVFRFRDDDDGAALGAPFVDELCVGVVPVVLVGDVDVVDGDDADIVEQQLGLCASL
jgi:hypothetical protein